MYEFKSLGTTSYEEITECFNKAFSDYYFSSRMCPEQLQQRLEMSGVDRNLSFGAFEDGQMVGFILNSSGVYNGKNAVFDAGTGVVPEHRGKHVFSDMFKFAERRLAGPSAQTYYLEVLQQNLKAIELYKKYGFSVEREYLVLGSDGVPVSGGAAQVVETEYSAFDEGLTAGCTIVRPCYEHSTDVLRRNPQLYRVWYTERQKGLSAFCVFCKENGAVLQMGYAELSDLEKMILRLTSMFSSVVIKNIDTDNDEVIEMLHAINYKDLARQFEMSKALAP